MAFADIHNHALWGCDDGADTREEMLGMIGQAYAGGVRLLCLTPHFHPGYFGDNRAASAGAFDSLRECCREKYPDLRLYLANELRYSNGCVGWLDEGLCRTMGAGRHVLVDFSEEENVQRIIHGLRRLLNGGYLPILAHAERYRQLWGKTGVLRQLRNDGVLLQVDTQALLGKFGLRQRLQARSIVKAGLADFVSSDAHDRKDRPPGMGEAYRLLEKLGGRDYADWLCWGHGKELFSQKTNGKDLDISNG